MSTYLFIFRSTALDKQPFYCCLTTRWHFLSIIPVTFHLSNSSPFCFSLGILSLSMLYCIILSEFLYTYLSSLGNLSSLSAILYSSPACKAFFSFLWVLSACLSFPSCYLPTCPSFPVSRFRTLLYPYLISCQFSPFLSELLAADSHPVISLIFRI